LEYPKGLSAGERNEAMKKLAGFPANLAQQLLDELAGRMQAGTIQVASLAYLRGLMRRAHAGKFTPEAAFQVAEKRERRRRNEAAVRRAEGTHRDAPQNTRRFAANAVENNPLVQRVATIRRKALRGGGGGEGG
jgi:hypothetical protein